MSSNIARHPKRLIVGLVAVALVLVAGGASLFYLREVHASGTGVGCVPASGTTNCNFRGHTANASFESTSADGCVTSSVSIFASETLVRNQSAGPSNSSGATVNLFSFDNCAGTVLLDTFGFSTSSTFTADSALNTATLDAVVPVTDFTSGNTSTLTIHMTWHGIGDISQQESINRFRSANFVFDTRFKGDSRDATASGTVSDGTTNFTPTSTVFAQLGNAQGGTMQSNR